MTWKSGRYEDEWLTRSFCPYLFHSLFSLLILSLCLFLFLSPFRFLPFGYTALYPSLSHVVN